MWWSFYVPEHCQAKIPYFVKTAYHDYFGVKLGDQDNPFTPYINCKNYEEEIEE